MFVQRKDGVIIGAFANRQPGYAEEELSDDAPELVEFTANFRDRLAGEKE